MISSNTFPGELKLLRVTHTKKIPEWCEGNEWKIFVLGVIAIFSMETYDSTKQRKVFFQNKRKYSCREKCQYIISEVNKTLILDIINYSMF